MKKIKTDSTLYYALIQIKGKKIRAAYDKTTGIAYPLSDDNTPQMDYPYYHFIFIEYMDSSKEI